jgi:hypothetical protein
VPDEFCYRGRRWDAAEIESVRQLIAAHPGLSRRRLSVELCRAWNWVQSNGQLRDMVARSLMLGLHRAGLIELPPARRRPPNHAITHRRVAAAEPVEAVPTEGRLAALGRLDLRLVRRTSGERLFAQLLSQHHYLGYSRPVGEHLKYLVVAGERPVACLAWSAAARLLGLRDEFIGGEKERSRRNLRLIAYNTRFLILPWVRAPHLASHLLGRVARQISRDWEGLYGHPLHLLETFVDTERFQGACYRAANWICLGRTNGRGTRAPTRRVTCSIKELWVYPLGRDFRAKLCEPAASATEARA